MIGIIDYGAGNLMSVYNAFKYLGAEANLCVTPEDVKGCDKLVFPGVGASRDAKDCLEEKGLIEPLLDVIKEGKPFLGICLGLQLLLDRSEESGGTEGIGLIPGEVKLFPASCGLKIPHMGWNNVDFIEKDCPIFKGIDNNSYFYFVHSYYCDVQDDSYVAGVTDYGVSFTAAIWKDNVFATQFHPERSQKNGLKIVENFIKL